jgi:hypothetical protein
LTRRLYADGYPPIGDANKELLAVKDETENGSAVIVL